MSVTSQTTTITKKNKTRALKKPQVQTTVGVVRSINLDEKGAYHVTVEENGKSHVIEAVAYATEGLTEGMLVNLNAKKDGYTYKLRGETKLRNSPDFKQPIGFF